MTEENEVEAVNMTDVQEGEARVNITWGGSNGDLPNPVRADALETEIRDMVTEAVRSGTVPGLAADEDADFSSFVVDRFPPTELRPFFLVQVRPKTAYGTSVTICSD